MNRLPVSYTFFFKNFFVNSDFFTACLIVISECQPSHYYRLRDFFSQNYSYQHINPVQQVSPVLCMDSVIIETSKVLRVK